MKSKIRLALVLSLAFHMVLLFSLFPGGNRRGSEVEGLVVALVSLDQIESAPILSGDSIGSSDLLPHPPAFPMESDENFDSMEEDASPSEPFFDPDAEAQFPPAFDQEEQEMTLPEEPAPSFDPNVPPAEPVEEPLPQEPSSKEPAFRLVAEEARSGHGSAGAEGEGGKESGSSGGGAPQPTVGDALPGRIGGAGGGQVGPRFVIPSAGRSNPKPHYPARARAEGREGTALLRVTILPTGKVGEALIERSSGHADLDRSAVEAVMRWRFLPARRGENPVVSSVRIPVTFSIDR